MGLSGGLLPFDDFNFPGPLYILLKRLASNWLKCQKRWSHAVRPTFVMLVYYGRLTAFTRVSTPGIMLHLMKVNNNYPISWVRQYS
mgnify:CR=1 FL=1